MLEYTGKRRGRPPKVKVPDTDAVDDLESYPDVVEPGTVRVCFSGPCLIGVDDLDMLPGQRFVIAGSSRNDGVFTVVGNDEDWFTVEPHVEDEPPAMVTVRLVETEQ